MQTMFNAWNQISWMFSVTQIAKRIVQLMLSVCSHILFWNTLSITSANHVGFLFRKIFPDSEITQKYCCSRTKTSAIVTEIVKFEEILVSTLQQGIVFSLSTDVIPNCVLLQHTTMMTLIIESSVLCISVLNGVFTSLNIATLVLDALKSWTIAFQNCIAFGTGNAPVMIGVENGVTVHLRKDA
ncbi:hypothetical protein PR048_017759 [Dryococelus australis]|uniref:Uncharacterized protein n=1 Tax=Dryococelus australis TaxID=614101 RepID=A0ABQ9HAD8_9NEOP|nr:hypothetical protein PR048_017759 [Dryococelus australis]